MLFAEAIERFLETTRVEPLRNTFLVEVSSWGEEPNAAAKQVNALLDVFVIAAGFVLRAIAGARVLDVGISYWLLLCTFVLALFLALCKRRHEKLFVDDAGGEGRASLEQYDRRLLDLLIAITASSTIVCYAMYTLAEETVTKFSTDRLAYTVPFVIFGVFRYLDLAYRHRKGDRPERILLTDVPILVNLALYGLSVIIICFPQR